MIYGFTHQGSGLGNMLHRYVATRVLAEDKGYDFSMIGRKFFKGKDFMKLDFGKPEKLSYRVEYPSGKIVVDENIPLWEEKTPFYNPEYNFNPDNVIIDGEFQDERYFEHRLDDIDGWLKTRPFPLPDDLCVIGFRGGEFYAFPELGLPKSYFEDGIEMMKDINPKMRFEVHTDDLNLASQFFPEYHCIKDIGINWRSMRNAKYAIIANSSFYIFPRLLKHHFDEAMTIAPRGWARRNIKQWSLYQNYYKAFKYI